MFNKIFVALDGSEPSQHTLSFASEIAFKWNAELILLSVIPPFPGTIYSLQGNFTVDLSEDDSTVKEIYKKLLKHASEIVKNKYFDLKVTEILREGHVPSTIVDIANDIEVDLIIMGSRGLSGIKSMFLGGVSKHVVEHCKQPILIVK